MASFRLYPASSLFQFLAEAVHHFPGYRVFAPDDWILEAVSLSQDYNHFGDGIYVGNEFTIVFSQAGRTRTGVTAVNQLALGGRFGGRASQQSRKHNQKY